MNRKDIIKQQQKALHDRYKQLIEKAYNLKETDHELSDISEYKALKLLGKISKLEYFSREESKLSRKRESQPVS